MMSGWIESWLSCDWPSCCRRPAEDSACGTLPCLARGEASARSDLDVLVDFEGPATFDGFMGLKFFLEDTLGVKVDLVTRAALKPRLRERVESEARRVA